jgi:hypothetical protein
MDCGVLGLGGFVWPVLIKIRYDVKPLQRRSALPILASLFVPLSVGRPPLLGAQDMPRQWFHSK